MSTFLSLQQGQRYKKKNNGDGFLMDVFRNLNIMKPSTVEGLGCLTTAEPDEEGEFESADETEKSDETHNNSDQSTTGEMASQGSIDGINNIETTFDNIRSNEFSTVCDLDGHASTNYKLSFFDDTSTVSKAINDKVTIDGGGTFGAGEFNILTEQYKSFIDKVLITQCDLDDTKYNILYVTTYGVVVHIHTVDTSGGINSRIIKYDLKQFETKKMYDSDSTAKEFFDSFAASETANKIKGEYTRLCSSFTNHTFTKGYTTKVYINDKVIQFIPDTRVLQNKLLEKATESGDEKKIQDTAHFIQKYLYDHSNNKIPPSWDHYCCAMKNDFLDTTEALECTDKCSNYYKYLLDITEEEDREILTLDTSSNYSSNTCRTNRSFFMPFEDTLNKSGRSLVRRMLPDRANSYFKTETGSAFKLLESPVRLKIYDSNKYYATWKSLKSKITGMIILPEHFTIKDALLYAYTSKYSNTRTYKGIGLTMLYLPESTPEKSYIQCDNIENCNVLGKNINLDYWNSYGDDDDDDDSKNILNRLAVNNTGSTVKNRLALMLINGNIKFKTRDHEVNEQLLPENITRNVYSVVGNKINQGIKDINKTFFGMDVKDNYDISEETTKDIFCQYLYNDSDECSEDKARQWSNTALNFPILFKDASNNTLNYRPNNIKTETYSDPNYLDRRNKIFSLKDTSSFDSPCGLEHMILYFNNSVPSDTFNSILANSIDWGGTAQELTVSSTYIPSLLNKSVDDFSDYSDDYDSLLTILNVVAIGDSILTDNNSSDDSSSASVSALGTNWVPAESNDCTNYLSSFQGRLDNLDDIFLSNIIIITLSILFENYTLIQEMNNIQSIEGDTTGVEDTSKFEDNEVNQQANDMMQNVIKAFPATIRIPILNSLVQSKIDLNDEQQKIVDHFNESDFTPIIKTSFFYIYLACCDIMTRLSFNTIVKNKPTLIFKLQKVRELKDQDICTNWRNTGFNYGHISAGLRSNHINRNILEPVDTTGDTEISQDKWTKLSNYIPDPLAFSDPAFSNKLNDAIYNDCSNACSSDKACYGFTYYDVEGGNVNDEGYSKGKCLLYDKEMAIKLHPPYKGVFKFNNDENENKDDGTYFKNLEVPREKWPENYENPTNMFQVIDSVDLGEPDVSGIAQRENKAVKLLYNANRYNVGKRLYRWNYHVLRNNDPQIRVDGDVNDISLNYGYTTNDLSNNISDIINTMNYNGGAETGTLINLADSLNLAHQKRFQQLPENKKLINYSLDNQFGESNKDDDQQEPFSTMSNNTDAINREGFNILNRNKIIEGAVNQIGDPPNVFTQSAEDTIDLNNKFTGEIAKTVGHLADASNNIAEYKDIINFDSNSLSSLASDSNLLYLKSNYVYILWILLILVISFVLIIVIKKKK